MPNMSSHCRSQEEAAAQHRRQGALRAAGIAGGGFMTDLLITVAVGIALALFAVHVVVAL